MNHQPNIDPRVLQILIKSYNKNSSKYHFFLKVVVHKYEKDLRFMDTYIENKDSINLDNFLTYVYKEYFDESIPYEIACDICLFYVDMKTKHSIVQEDHEKEVSKLYKNMKQNKNKINKKIQRAVYKIVYIDNMDINSIDETRLN